MKRFLFVGSVLLVFAIGCGGSSNSGGKNGGPSQDAQAGQDSQQNQDVGNQNEVGNQTDTSVDRGGQQTTDTGTCKPQCTNKTCGDDGCGGSCGTCAQGQDCYNGNCVPHCDNHGFKPVKDGAAWKALNGPDDPHGEFRYEAITSASPPVDMIRLIIRQTSPYNGPVGPGTYKINGQDYFADPIVVLGLKGCDTNGCKEIYMGAEGSIKITSMDRAQAPFKAVFENLKLKEVNVTNTISFKNNGKTWCLNNYNISVDKVIQLPLNQCVPDGTGRGYYDNIGDLTLTNCLGQKVHLHSFCGKTKIVWLVAAAAWCPHCAEYLPKFVQFEQEHSQDVTLLVYLANGYTQNVAPTQDECKQYAQSKGIDPAKMFIGAPDWSTLVEYIDPGTDQVGYPFSFILLGKNMAYVWSSAYAQDPRDKIEELLPTLQ